MHVDPLRRNPRRCRSYTTSLSSFFGTANRFFTVCVRLFACCCLSYFYSRYFAAFPHPPRCRNVLPCFPPLRVARASIKRPPSSTPHLDGISVRFPKMQKLNCLSPPLLSHLSPVTKSLKYLSGSLHLALISSAPVTRCVLLILFQHFPPSPLCVFDTPFGTEVESEFFFFPFLRFCSFFLSLGHLRCYLRGRFPPDTVS